MGKGEGKGKGRDPQTVWRTGEGLSPSLYIFCKRDPQSFTLYVKEGRGQTAVSFGGRPHALRVKTPRVANPTAFDDFLSVHAAISFPQPFALATDNDRTEV